MHSSFFPRSLDEYEIQDDEVVTNVVSTPKIDSSNVRDIGIGFSGGTTIVYVKPTGTQTIFLKATEPKTALEVLKETFWSSGRIEIPETGQRDFKKSYIVAAKRNLREDLKTYAEKVQTLEGREWLRENFTETYQHFLKLKSAQA